MGINVSYKKYKTPKNKKAIEDYYIPRLKRTSILRFIYNLLTGFDKNEKPDNTFLKIFKDNSFKEKLILTLFAGGVGFVIYLAIIFKPLGFILSFIFGLKIAVYSISILIGFFKFSFFTIKLMWQYELGVPLIRLSRLGVSQGESDEEKLAYHLHRYNEGDLTKKEYGREKDKILSN